MRENDRPPDSVAPWVRNRIDRGERVRERVDDRGRERVIEHAGRQTNLQGPAPTRDRDRDRPAVSNDDWRHRPEENRGPVADRGPGPNVDDGARNRSLDHRPEVVDVPRQGRGNGGDRRGGPRVDDDRELTRPPSVTVDRNPPRVSDDGAWRRPQPNTDVRVVQPGRPTSPGPMYRGQGGGNPGGGPVIIERNPGAGMGGGRPAGPTMQHGGGGGAPARGPAPGPSPSMSHGGGGGSPGGGGGAHGGQPGGGAGAGAGAGGAQLGR